MSTIPAMSSPAAGNAPDDGSPEAAYDRMIVALAGKRVRQLIAEHGPMGDEGKARVADILRPVLRVTR